MPELTATARVGRSPGAVLGLLLNIAELAEWNPAVIRTLSDEQRAIQGRVYELVTRVPGKSTLVYEEISAHRVVWRLRVTGGVELGEWILQPRFGGTQVTHTMSHSGAVFALLRNNMRQVPQWRVDKLVRRLEGQWGEGRR